MPITRQQTDLLLADLESRIKQRGDWRDRTVFHRELEYDLRPILDTAADPEHVRSWVRAMLVRNGHAADLPHDAETAT
jgi:hypothetical protein